MYTVSDRFKNYVKQMMREFQVQVTIGSTTYDKSTIVDVEIIDSIISEDELILGSAVSSKLIVKIKTTDTIASNARVVPSIRMDGVAWKLDDMTWNTEEAILDDAFTEWIPLGAFYIDTRTYQDGVWTFTCYDRLMFAQQPYTSALSYPALMTDVVGEICTQLGITLLDSLVLEPTYTIPATGTDLITIRDMLGYIASANGCVARITKDEKLAFVKIVAEPPTDESLTPDMFFKVEKKNEVKTITKLVATISKDGNTQLTAGTGTPDTTMTFYNPFITQDMLDDVLIGISGYTYVPYVMEWRGLPYLEVGDTVNITLRDTTDFNSIILVNKLIYKGGLKVTTEAPAPSPQKSEFNYTGSLSQYIKETDKKSLKEYIPYYGVKIGRDQGIVIEREDGKSKAIFNSDVFTMQANGVDKIYFDAVTEKYKINGTLEAVDGLFSGSIAIGSGDNIFKADSNGIYLGNAVFGAAPFRVSMTGAVTCSNINIDGGTISIGTKFSVTSEGILTAVDGNFSGQLNAATGTFAGQLTAQNAVINNNSADGSLNFHVSNSYIIMKSYLINGVPNFYIAKGTEPGQFQDIVNIDRFDIYADRFYTGAIHATEVYINGYSAATQSWVSVNYSPLGHVHVGSTSTNGTHNHGIPDGSKLAVYDSGGTITGYVYFSESGSHYHTLTTA